MLDGQLVRGSHGFAAEIGHMTVREGGRPCVCGKRGCWEAYASGGALGRLAREQMGLSGEAATAAAMRGDVEALVLLTEYAGEVALGIGSLIEILDPEVVVIGGGLVEVGDALLAPIRSAVPGFVYSWEHRAPTPVLAAQLGERAGAIGAALLAAERT